jgi:lambda repressor-like predicted transcriptional regulator
MFVHTGQHSQQNNKNVLMPQHVDLHIVTLNMSGSEMAQKVLQEAVAARTLAAILKKRVTLQEHICPV